MSNCIAAIQGMRVWTEFISVRPGPVAEFYGLGNDLGCKNEAKNFTTCATYT